jgi:membrane-associated phospholipid phosphatase
MRELDTLFSWVAGEYTFQNEFVFSGHTAVPFLFYLFFESPGLRAVMLGGSLAMAAAVLATHNHYTVDVLSAYLVGYGIYALSDALYRRFVRPLYLRRAPPRGSAGAPW